MFFAKSHLRVVGYEMVFYKSHLGVVGAEEVFKGRGEWLDRGSRTILPPAHNHSYHNKTTTNAVIGACGMPDELAGLEVGLTLKGTP